MSTEYFQQEQYPKAAMQAKQKIKDSDVLKAEVSQTDIPE